MADDLAGAHDVGIGIGTIGDLLDAVAVRTGQLVSSMRELAVLSTMPTALPEWSWLEVACHLRYGAESTLRMTLAALHDEQTSRYPAGRPRQRPGTLAPRDGEREGDVVASLAAGSAALERIWRDLRVDDWSRPVRGRAAEDPGGVTVEDLLVLRATEVEVHGTDLDAGLPDWSSSFVAASLPRRLAALDGRWPAAAVTGSWLLTVRGGRTWAVHARAGVATAHPTEPGAEPPVDVRIEGDPRDVLALLLGRHDWDRLTVAGPQVAAEAFARAFPGP